jgi:hypothetical protein
VKKLELECRGASFKSCWNAHLEGGVSSLNNFQARNDATALLLVPGPVYFLSLCRTAKLLLVSVLALVAVLS